MVKSKVLILVFSLLSLQGCAAVALTAGSMAADAGIEHTLSGISFKTFAQPIEDVRYAAFQTLERLDMDIVDQTQVKDGWVIIAIANDRTIEIELEALTRRFTRMRVVAHKGSFFFKDAATATEIIVQMAETIAADMEASLSVTPPVTNASFVTPPVTNTSFVAPLAINTSSPAPQEARMKLAAPRITYRFIQQPEPAILTRGK